MSVAVVVPGQRIATVTDCQAGDGTYERDGYIFSSVVGILSQTASGSDKRSIVHVQRQIDASPVPKVGDVITGQIVRITTSYASVKILVVNEKPVLDAFKGIIRKQDVRQFEKDAVLIHKCFRPGDIVKCRVISLGDAQSYFLSTGENPLGVVFAKSLAGHTMVPISWQEMQCPVTQLKESRKCAKPE